MKVIDPHVHLFNLEEGDYSWLKAEVHPSWFKQEKILKNFDETSLNLSSDLQLAGFVHIEAGFDNEHPWREIEWLEKACEVPFKAIAGLDLTLSELKFREKLTRLEKLRTFCGIRHIFSGDVTQTLESQQVIDNLVYFSGLPYIFELQMDISQPVAVDKINAIAQGAKATFVLNHAGLPSLSDIRDKTSNWQKGLKVLSCNENVYVKLSGWEMFDLGEERKLCEEVVTSLCIALYGEDRVMFASNFPLCLFDSNYQGCWLKPSKETSTQIEKLQYLNAKRVYGF
jgi:predicted TIM-barrel fold metal-dependent hydrolase